MTINDCESGIGEPLDSAPEQIEFDTGLVCIALNINGFACGFVDKLVGSIGQFLFDTSIQAVKDRFIKKDIDLLIWKVAEVVYGKLLEDVYIPPPDLPTIIPTELLCRDRPNSASLPTQEDIKVALLGALIGRPTLLIQAIADLWWYENWFEYCKCKQPVPDQTNPPPKIREYSICGNRARINGIVVDTSELLAGSGLNYSAAITGAIDSANENARLGGRCQPTYRLISSSPVPPTWTIRDIPGTPGTARYRSGQKYTDYRSGAPGSLQQGDYKNGIGFNGTTRTLVEFRTFNDDPLIAVPGASCLPIGASCIQYYQRNDYTFNLTNDAGCSEPNRRHSDLIYIGVGVLNYEFCTARTILRCEDVPELCPCQYEDTSVNIIEDCNLPVSRKAQYWNTECPSYTKVVQVNTKCGELEARDITFYDYEPTQLI